MMFVYTFAIIIFITYGGLCGYLYVNQRSLIYFPTPAVELSDRKYIVVNNENVALKIWVLNEGKSQAIIYFGGNAESVETSLELFEQLYPNHTVYVLNYRGYGGSTGQPSESGFYIDALHIYDKITSSYRSISTIGRSLGSGVATYLAANRKIDRLALITPYDSIVSVASSAYPLFPVSLLIQDRYESISRAAGISAKVLVIIAELDEVILRESTEKLAASFDAQQMTKVVLAGESHNSLATNQEYIDLLKAFFK
ncbi:MAG: alpha/beta hydrolase [Thiohalomonadales bacterium]